jgi:murein L,D-transpeptidase YcbB/YkuD
MFAPVIHGARAQAIVAPPPEYVRLQEALKQYRLIAEAGGWPSVPAGPTIEPGSNDPRVTMLAERLRATGDAESGGLAFPDYDDELQAAVLRFQSRHGLEADALVGPATLRALNVPVERRLEKFYVNLERTRQVFDNTYKDFVLVNIPAFEAYFFRDGKRVWETNVVVGKVETATPPLEARIRQVVLNPTWTVPHSIASEELLPRAQADPGFLARDGYDLFNPGGDQVDPATVDWQALHRNNFPFTLVQRPGTLNELGKVKFLFPNPHGVYMHDTRSKFLFSHYSRAFSHGCIRLQAPLDLAERLLVQEGWTRQQIDIQLQSAETRTINLAEPLPVILAYLTAVVDDAGTVHFYRDIYDMDPAASRSQ